MKKRTILILLTLFVLGALVASCAQGEATQTKTVTTTVTGQVTTTTVTNTHTITSTITTTLPTTMTTTPANLPTATAGELASMGSSVYSENCVVPYCHGEWESEGKFEFLQTDFAFFDNAQKYYSFIVRFMPGNNPSALTAESYLAVTAYILVETGHIQPEELFGLANLAIFPLPGN
jgi:hypothetical protein